MIMGSRYGFRAGSRVRDVGVVVSTTGDQLEIGYGRCYASDFHVSCFSNEGRVSVLSTVVLTVLLLTSYSGGTDRLSFRSTERTLSTRGIFLSEVGSSGSLSVRCLTSGVSG